MTKKIDALQSAINKLEISDVCILSSRSFVSADFQPKYEMDNPGLETTTMHRVLRSQTYQVVTAEDAEDDDAQDYFRVIIEFGMRWSKSEAIGVEADENEVDSVDNKICAEIRAEYAAEYLVKETLEADERKEFSLRNASYHVWPFWREFLSSQCTRMNLPKVIQPTMQLPSNQHKNELTVKTSD